MTPCVMHNLHGRVHTLSGMRLSRRRPCSLVGNCQVDLGMYQTAIATYEQARENYTRSDEIRGELLCDLNTGLCHIQLGNWNQAISILEAIRHTTNSVQAPRTEGAACHYLGIAYKGRGDVDAAREALNTSLEIRERIGQVGISYDTIAMLLRISIELDEQQSIKELIHSLIDWLELHDGAGIKDPIEVWLTMSDAYAALGSEDGAYRALCDGYALLTERAGRITDPEARTSYLTNVPADRELIDRATHAGIADSAT